MRNRLFLLSPLSLILLIAGCKTTEANYRASYERVIAHQQQGLTAEELAAIDREKAAPQVLFQGDSLRLRRAPLTQYKLDPKSDLQEPPVRRYGVAVAEFSQMFNARSATARLRQAGYPDAVLLRDRNAPQPFYVVAATSDTLATAVDILRNLQDQPSTIPLRLAPGFPCILQKTN